jgi:hypothetical protein
MLAPLEAEGMKLLFEEPENRTAEKKMLLS